MTELNTAIEARIQWYQQRNRQLSPGFTHDQKAEMAANNRLVAELRWVQSRMLVSAQECRG